MANTDTIIANGTGQTVREDIQTNLQALKSNNSSSTDPSGATLTAYMSFADTGDGIYKIHNGTTFQSVLDISGATSAGTHIAAPGTASIPGYRFLNSSGTPLQSGMGLPTDTRLGFFHGGSEKLSVLSSGNVGIGTTAPSNTLTVLGGQTLYTTNTDAALSIEALNSSSTDDAFIDLVADTTYQDYGLRIRRNGVSGGNGSSEILHRGTGNLDIGGSEACSIRLITTGAERFKVSSVGAIEWGGHTGTVPTGGIASGVIAVAGYQSRPGTVASQGYGGNVWNFYWNGTSLQMHIDNVHVGNVNHTAASDYRIKQNIATQTESGIDKIKQLRPVTYQFKDYLVFKADSVTREGFIAHEVQEVIPSAVDDVKDGDSIQSLNTDAIVSVLTKALQEAVAKIEVLEAKVAALEAG
jgi:hypothetical protein